MASSSQVMIICVLLLTANAANAWEWEDVLCKVAAPVVGGVAAVVAAPVVLGAAGFGAGGIAVGSVAAKIMSAAWSTGMGVGAVAGLQSAGAAGLTLAQTGVVGTIGAGIARLVTGSCDDKGRSCNDD